jgi:hypothetical protein
MCYLGASNPPLKLCLAKLIPDFKISSSDVYNTVDGNTNWCPDKWTIAASCTAPHLSVAFPYLLFELPYQPDLQAVWLPRSDRKTQVVHQIIYEVYK